MIFDPVPKESRKDFFNREDEIERIKSLSSPITLVLGFRRTGKSSVIRIALNELNFPYIYIDLRKFEEKGYASYKDLILELQKEINRLVKRFPSITGFIKRIEGVKILGNEIRLRWGGDKRVSISSLLESLNDWAEDRVILTIDEAQELLNLRGANLLSTFAYSFDNLRKVKIILSGSKMGLLYRYLGKDNPKSPLYGRAMNEIELYPFNREKSEEFLRLGFSELKINFDKFDIVYENLGGIPGWLTYFGYYYYQKRDLSKALSKTINTAIGLIMEEFNNFLKTRAIAKDRYVTVMKTVINCASWSEIKRALEAREGMEISDSEIYNYLNQLIDSSWIVKKDDKKYCPSEPLIAKAFS
ncbi:MAG: AAA family ATPase [Desulfurococcales archaeon]|nr:AAA family ATPase [Desulfurococcales archaeon]